MTSGSTDRTSPFPQPASPAAPGALNGVRILDLTSVIMGPYATQILADHGADVIFVEHPSGKGTRELGAEDFCEFSGISLNLLRNKRSLCVDMKKPDGREAILKLAATCHAVVTNLRPGPLGRLGLTCEDFLAVKSELIFCQAIGFPGDTARADDPAYDDIIQSECGLADAYLQIGGSPQLSPTILADKVCGLTIANTIMMALFHQAATGRGQRIEIPMIDVMRAFMMVEHGAGAISAPDVGKAGYKRVLNPERGPQKTSDGWIMALPYRAEAFDAIFKAGGRDDLVGDHRTRGRGPMIYAEFLYRQLRPIIAQRSTAQWIDFCRDNDIPVGEVPELDDIARSYPIEEHPAFGAYRSVPPPVRMSKTPARLRQHAPMLGQHTEDVLREAGINGDRLASLEKSGTVWRKPAEQQSPISEAFQARAEQTAERFDGARKTKSC